MDSLGLNGTARDYFVWQYMWQLRDCRESTDTLAHRKQCGIRVKVIAQAAVTVPHQLHEDALGTPRPLEPGTECVPQGVKPDMPPILPDEGDSRLGSIFREMFAAHAAKEPILRQQAFRAHMVANLGNKRVMKWLMRNPAVLRRFRPYDNKTLL
nr:hypothetical protein [Terrimicrobium sacchariphilum]